MSRRETTLHVGDSFIFRGLVGQELHHITRARVQAISIAGRLILEIATDYDEFDPTHTIQLDYFKFTRLTQQGVWDPDEATLALYAAQLEQKRADFLIKIHGMGDN